MAEGIDHDHDDQAKRQPDADVAHSTVRDAIDDDGTRPRKDESKRADELGGKPMHSSAYPPQLSPQDLSRDPNQASVRGARRRPQPRGAFRGSPGAHWPWPAYSAHQNLD